MKKKVIELKIVTPFAVRIVVRGGGLKGRARGGGGVAEGYVHNREKQPTCIKLNQLFYFLIKVIQIIKFLFLIKYKKLNGKLSMKDSVKFCGKKYVEMPYFDLLLR